MFDQQTLDLTWICVYGSLGLLAWYDGFALEQDSLENLFLSSLICLLEKRATTHSFIARKPSLPISNSFQSLKGSLLKSSCKFQRTCLCKVSDFIAFTTFILNHPPQEISRAMIFLKERAFFFFCYKSSVFDCFCI